MHATGLDEAGCHGHLHEFLRQVCVDRQLQRHAAVRSTPRALRGIVAGLPARRMDLTSARTEEPRRRSADAACRRQWPSASSCRLPLWLFGQSNHESNVVLGQTHGPLYRLLRCSIGSMPSIAPSAPGPDGRCQKQQWTQQPNTMGRNHNRSTAKSVLPFGNSKVWATGTRARTTARGQSGTQTHDSEPGTTGRWRHGAITWGVLGTLLKDTQLEFEGPAAAALAP